MNRMKRKMALVLILMILAVSFLPAVQASPFVTEAEAVTKVTKIKLTTTKLIITKGESTALSAEVFPENVTNDTVSWKSSNKKVATVNSKGVIKGIRVGTATITAIARDGSGKKAACKVIVKAAAPNINNSIMTLTAQAAAKKLWLNHKTGVGSLRVYLKGARTSRKYQLQTRIKVHRTRENKKGMWDLFIMDKSVSFYGIKVGMTRKQTATILKKAKWRKIKEEKEYTWDGYTNVYYKSKDSKSYAYKNKGILEVRYDEKGRIWMMHYSID